MFINGLPDYDRNGKEVKTGLVIAKATCDGDIRVTGTGKEVGSISVRAYSRKDGTAAFLTIKGWGKLARQLSVMVKGDTIVAAGRIETREYNGKTYTDLVADYIFPSEAAQAPQKNFPIHGGAVPVSGDDFQEEVNPGELPF